MLNMLLRQAYEREIAISDLVSALEALEIHIVEPVRAEPVDCVEPILLDHLLPWIGLAVGIVLGYALHVAREKIDDNQNPAS